MVQNSENSHGNHDALISPQLRPGVDTIEEILDAVVFPATDKYDYSNLHVDNAITEDDFDFFDLVSDVGGKGK